MRQSDKCITGMNVRPQITMTHIIHVSDNKMMIAQATYIWLRNK